MACIACLAVIAASAQKLTFNVSNVTVKQAMSQLKKQTGYSFVFYAEDIDVDKIVSVKADNADLTRIVGQILAHQNVNYEIKGKNIVVNKARGVRTPVANASTEAKRKVSGKIVDPAGEPVIGATVKEEGTGNATVTDIDGNYTFYVTDANAKLYVSYVGYRPRTVKLSESSLIRLSEDTESLNEVVVIGYGTVKKSDLTGSVVSVGEGKFTEGITTNAFQMINGKAAGVNVSQTSSAPGASTKIQIRGAGSINSSNDALVVVDGMPGVDPSSVNADDVKSIEVLKDASAAAIYGTRAANGVILITTKSGAKASLRVKFGAELGFQSVAKRMKVLNGRDYMETLNALRSESNHPDGAIYTQDQINSVGRGTDWQDEIFRNGAPVQNYRLGFSGGGEKHTFYLGLGVMDQQGLVDRSKLTKYNVRANVNLTPTDFLRFKFNMNYTRDDGTSIFEGTGVNEGAGVINSAIQFDPTLPAGKNPETGRYYTNDYISLDNPLALLKGIDTDRHSNNAYGTLAVELEPLKNLILTARVGATVNSYMNNFYRTRETITGLASGGSANKRSGESTQWLAEFLLNYSKTFHEIHDLSVMFGTTYEQFLSEYVTGNATGFLSDVLSYNNMHGGDTLNGDDVYSFKSRNRLHGLLGRFNYNLRDKYLLTASFRYDGTSRFSENHKYAFFPSMALAWRMSEESFMKRLKQLSYLKLRVGYGRLGNQGINNYATLRTLVAGGSVVFGNSLSQGLVLARLPNPNLRWETTEEYNVGVDFGFFDNRISGSVDLFVRNTKDQLFDKLLPSAIGFSSVKVNAGNVRNSGLDLVLNTVNVRSKRLSWETSVNLSLLKNEVKSLPDYMPRLITGDIASFVSGFNITRVGDPIYAFYGFKVDGIFQQGDDIAHSAQPNARPGDLKFHNYDNDDRITSEDRTILGKPFPDVTFGITNTFKYKNFTLGVFLQGVYGISTLDVNVLESLYPTNEYRNRLAKYYKNRWTPSNPTNRYPSGVNPTNYGGQYVVNSLTVVDASFLRVKNVSLTYDIPLKSHRILQTAQVYASVDNLCTFTSYDGFDPDASVTGSSSVSKVNYNSYPLSRTIRFGVNLTF
ncbi:TonB-dependent receptor [Prevotella sp. A2931]|uniref:TonB-dependent receptor n=2 Tax=Prevotellaceae TaxID=171552 RepID=A0ABS3M5R4_9BACT|nr:TonB-dependent receptor [Prevotella illustrans]PTL27323.1 SusC/RagA family TonB-linked outer membrane protein [Prevotella sp. oral taxon 820]